MGGLTLERPEFLVLMDAAQATAVVGLDTEALVPRDREQHRAVVSQGIEMLKQRGALRVVGDVNVLDANLLAMARLVAAPEVAVMTTRDNPGQGQQLFLHYLAGQLVVEQTLPSETQHRLALVPDRAALVERLLDILPVQADPPPARLAVSLKQKQFLNLKQWAEGNQGQAAKELLSRQGLAAEAAETLVAALAHPTFGGTVALLRCSDGEIVDGRNVALVQGPQAAWQVRQVEPGSATFEVATCHSAEVRDLLAGWLAELSA